MGIRDLAANASVPTTQYRPRQRKKKPRNIMEILAKIKEEIGLADYPDFDVNTKKKIIEKIGETAYASNQAMFELFLRIYRSKNHFQLFLDWLERNS